MNSLPKILVVLGPTASGKSDLAVQLAKRFNGEVISADSRQVYEGLDIGTGKITEQEMQGIPHHLLDIANPQDIFSVDQFKMLALEKIYDILKRNKLPILCGGTGFYIQAVVDNVDYPHVPPNKSLRDTLSTKSTTELFALLQEKDPERASEIDPQNPHRLIRALEITEALGVVPKIKSQPLFDTLQIGTRLPDEILKEKIYKRLISRLEQGMIEEAKTLHQQGLSFERMESLGLEYRYLSRFLQNHISKDEMITQLNSEIWHYAKRQKTWFKKDQRICWFDPKDIEKISEEIKKFI